MAENKTAESKMLEKQYNALFYKDKPLVRHDNILYYGFPSDKFIIKMDVLEKNSTDGLDISKKVLVELLDISGKFEKLVKKSEKTGLFGALEIGAIWLDRSLTENKPAAK